MTRHLEGEMSRKQRKEEDPDAPQIGLRAHVLLLREDLGRRVVRRAAEQLELLVGGAHVLGEAEVGKQQAAGAVEEQIIQLEVAMDDVHHQMACARCRWGHSCSAAGWCGGRCGARSHR